VVRTAWHQAAAGRGDLPRRRRGREAAGDGCSLLDGRARAGIWGRSARGEDPVPKDSVAATVAVEGVSVALCVERIWRLADAPDPGDLCRTVGAGGLLNHVAGSRTC